MQISDYDLKVRRNGIFTDPMTGALYSKTELTVAAPLIEEEPEEKEEEQKDDGEGEEKVVIEKPYVFV